MKAVEIRADWIALLKNACYLDLTEQDFLDDSRTSVVKTSFFEKLKDKPADSRLYFPNNAFSEVCDILNH